MQRKPDGLIGQAGQNAQLMLALALLFWGGNVIAARLAAGEISPAVMVCLRWAIVALLLLLIARRNVILDWPKLVPYWRSVILMGMFG